MFDPLWHSGISSCTTWSHLGGMSLMTFGLTLTFCWDGQVQGKGRGEAAMAEDI